MAKEEELKELLTDIAKTVVQRIDLKVNVSCCEGCRRKVMKAMSLKGVENVLWFTPIRVIAAFGSALFLLRVLNRCAWTCAGVLRTEIKPSHDRVIVVGDVDPKVLVKKLSKVGKIAEVLPPPPSDDGGKKRDDDHNSGGKKQDYGDKPAPVAAEGKSKEGKDDGRSAGDDKPAAACKPECKKCAHGDADDNNKDGKEKKAPSKDTAAGEEEGGGFGGKSFAPDHAAAAVQQFHHYHRAEPAMVVPVHVPYYPPPAAAPYYGYYAMPPPMVVPRRPLRPQPSRFDVDYFNEDNTVGCHVM
ncbi:hypothetical protein EJB05_39281 [Eragrostis curvula]|uniref:HMA domain-containing protein n=1 Tax=Eragrostis curvula TaxID=38414 RepID=A0A5J9TWG6_9POAL|nr:hypothetical protein EJB05_39281 [Eragrostis curvula]